LVAVFLLGACATTGAQDEIQARVQRKAKQVQENARKWVEAGGDQSKIAPLAQEVDKAVKAGNPKDAEAALDKILAIVAVAPGAESVPGARDTAAATTTRVTASPADAEIVYPANGYVYTMRADGSGITQLTSGQRRTFEHVTISPDRRWMVGNVQGPPTATGQSTSKLWLYDLQKGTETQLLPNFRMAGNGGHLKWDSQGFIYFAGVEKDPFPAPKARAEFIANAAANEVYKVKYDGTGLTRLTRTPDRGEADVDLSDDGKLITFMDNKIQPPDDYTEIWVMNSDGTNLRLVYKGGKPGVDSVHDPAFSPDGKKIAFSKVNSAYRNFRDKPDANTAHDLYSINIDGTGLTRITRPGPISIAPDWRDDFILYFEATDRENPPYVGIALIRPDGTGHRRLKENTNLPKWIR
jgi:Tol biopolymer transport system component